MSKGNNKNWGNTGAKYLKTGDETGHLCYKCDYPMVIVKKGVFRNWSVRRRIQWLIRCQCCGREVSNRYVEYSAWAEVYI